MRAALRRLAPRAAAAILVATLLSGCQGSGRGMLRRSAAKEPALLAPEGEVVVATPAPRAGGWAARHPALTRPREYYEESGGNNGGMSKVIASGRAAFIGVPSGIAAEIKQMVTGVPAPSRAAASTY
jgi:hypothetical protein